jgi:hypothetical protein
LTNTRAQIAARKTSVVAKSRFIIFDRARRLDANNNIN